MPRSIDKPNPLDAKCNSCLFCPDYRGVTPHHPPDPHALGELDFNDQWRSLGRRRYVAVPLQEHAVAAHISSEFAPNSGEYRPGSDVTYELQIEPCFTASFHRR